MIKSSLKKIVLLFQTDSKIITHTEKSIRNIIIRFKVTHNLLFVSSKIFLGFSSFIFFVFIFFHSM